MLQAVLLDVDGVVVRTELFSSRLSREYDIPADIIEPFFEGPFLACLVGEADLKEMIAPYLAEWKWPGTVEGLLHYWFEMENTVDQALLVEVQQLRQQGVRVYVATNQEKFRTAFLRSEMGFDQLFDGVLASCEIGQRKPEWDFFAACWERMGQPEKQQVLFMDDQAANAQAGRLFGFQAEQFTSLASFRSATVRGLLE